MRLGEASFIVKLNAVQPVVIDRPEASFTRHAIVQAYVRVMYI